MDDSTDDTVIVVSRTLEMKPVILNILNVAGSLAVPLSLMNVLVSAMVSKRSVIFDIWEPEEAEIYMEHSFLYLWLRPEQVMTTNIDGAQIALCIFILDSSSFNPCLALGYAMLNIVKDYGKEGVVVSVAYEVNSFGAYAILLLGDGFQASYDEARRMAKDSPETYGDSYGMQIAVDLCSHHDENIM
ncbi:uncharacterized protein EV420DRAFT_1488931 [Desarmillaria tabescens]|uniref:Uncharacterized protein n=1 Tax=Armillaria tabescens TaxID=1929756 RepID=A0AA39J0E5_ARMTA|nr:uncharacterized protein EV420DRAFT_1488931 [Desarmillaria tabescens]KAK0433836.1 hypothetical protein EV420DRAFT_1488931 [Desarmillaria tabescens]